jgi:hypothetical protein
MSRYYFHVKRGQVTILDHEGIELADGADAEVEAAQRAKRLVKGASFDPSASAGRIIVADDNWHTLFELPF